MSKVTFDNSNIEGIKISALIYTPDNFDSKKKYPTIVVSHPTGGVKEQTASIYASKLTKYGFVTVAFDRSYQGESTGLPRQLENPFVSTEDISAVIDYLETLEYVDSQRIGTIGICGGGGYNTNAAINDHRIKAVGGVSAVNIGLMYREGWDKGTAKPADALAYLDTGSKARTSDFQSKQYQRLPLIPDKREDGFNEEYKESFDYYRTPRAQNPRSVGYILTRNLNQLVTYDASAFSEIYLTQPLLYIAGSRAGTKWFSDVIVERAASKEKQVYLVNNASHFDMYDIPKYVDEAIEQFGPFFQKHL